MQKENLTISIETDHEVYTLKKSTPKRVFLLLHGYLLNGEYILKTLKDSLPDNSLIIAPNGPFLVPVKKNEGYKAKYAWYFFDPAQKNFYVDFEPGGKYLKNILERYNTSNLPVTVIGYSQGGYLAPRVANHIKEIDTIIGLACVFRNNRFEFNEQVSYSQINAKNDLIVDINGAKEEFSKLSEQKNKGQFIELENSAHRLDDDYFIALKSLID